MVSGIFKSVGIMFLDLNCSIIKNGWDYLIGFEMLDNQQV